MKKLSNNKQIGRIYSFDGEAGIIVAQNGYYHFDKKDFIDKDLKKGSLVEFVSNTLVIGAEKELVAVFIDKFEEDIHN